MSREFHWTERNYMHKVLENVENDREVTGEPVADAIREVMIALAPVEYAVASRQAGDSGIDRVMLACVENLPAVNAAVNTLLNAMEDYKKTVKHIVEDYKP